LGLENAPRVKLLNRYLEATKGRRKPSVLLEKQKSLPICLPLRILPIIAYNGFPRTFRRIPQCSKSASTSTTASDEYFLELPEEVVVFKIRETWISNWEERKWVYDERTGRGIDGESASKTTKPI